MPDLGSFHEQVKRGDLTAIKQTMQVDPALLDKKNEAGQSAFLLSKYYGQTEVADYLLSLQPELDVWDTAVAGRTETVLRAADQDPSLLAKQSSDGWTLLHLAAFFGHVDLAEALMGRGVSPDIRSTNAMQNTPLHAAVAGRKVELVRSLLQHGADANAVQHGGWRPLHGGAGNGDLVVVELLLAHGADKNARAENNQSALDLALMKGHQNVSILLEEQVAKPQS